MKKEEKYRLMRRLLEISVMDVVRALKKKPNYAHVIYRFERGEEVRYPETIDSAYDELIKEKIGEDEELSKIVEFIRNM